LDSAGSLRGGRRCGGRPPSPSRTLMNALAGGPFSSAVRAHAVQRVKTRKTGCLSEIGDRVALTKTGNRFFSGELAPRWRGAASALAFRLTAKRRKRAEVRGLAFTCRYTRAFGRREAGPDRTARPALALSVRQIARSATTARAGNAVAAAVPACPPAAVGCGRRTDPRPQAPGAGRVRWRARPRFGSSSPASSCESCGR
jgi:hypothetical protein